MKNEDRIVELLSEMLIKQDAFIAEMAGLKAEISIMKRDTAAIYKIQVRQENHMMKILEIIADDVPKFEQVIEMEQLKDGKVVLKRVR